MSRLKTYKYTNKRIKSGNLSPKMQEILDTYLSVVRSERCWPSIEHLGALGLKRDKIREFFGTVENLRQYAKDHHPELIENIVEERIVEQSTAHFLAPLIKKHRRFVITSAVNGAEVHQGFLKSIRQYCNKQNALLIVVPAGLDRNRMSADLAADAWAFDKVYLNSNIHISNIHPAPKAINPLTGVARIGQRNGSTIIGSPKQFLEFVAVANNKVPHAVMSTGSITEPDYSSPKGQIKKNDIMATHDHVLGAIVVEIENDKFYHFRQIQSEKCGAFIDLGVRYDGKTVKKVGAEAFIMGDLHAGEVDPTAKQAWMEALSLVKTKRIFIHDGFNGHSIGHHEWDNAINRAILAREKRLSLEEELRVFAKELESWQGKASEIVIVKSNHDEFLSKHYLQKCKYTNEPENHWIGLRLGAAMVEGHDPLRFAVEKIVGIKNPNKYRWLEIDEPYLVAGVECGSHGHLGANGSKGSANTLEKAYNSVIVGHSHTPKIQRSFWQVGTTSILRPSYAKGNSSWCHSSGFVYKNGSRQLINSFGGKWKI